VFSMAAVPSSAGLLIASEVIARLLGEAEW